MTEIDHICVRFDSGVGFSNGWAELAPKKPPAVRAELLDRDLGRGRTEYALMGSRVRRAGIHAERRIGEPA